MEVRILSVAPTSMRRRTQKISDFDPCGQKKYYVSRNSALSDSARQHQESLGNVIKKPYKCKFCKGWHLTSIA